MEGISSEWEGLQSIVRVTRKVKFKKQISQEVGYFISSLPATTSAKKFGEGIRCHWNIESFHYIKDVTFEEDKWKVCKKNAPVNYSLVRNLAINIFRKNNLNEIKATTEKCFNKVAYMMSLF